MFGVSNMVRKKEVTVRNRLETLESTFFFFVPIVRTFCSYCIYVCTGISASKYTFLI